MTQGASGETHILSTAAELVARAQHRNEALRDELAQLEQRKSVLEAELETASLKARRLANFSVHDGSAYLCPQCWIEEESASPLSLKQGGGWRDDYFLCELCMLEIKLGGDV